jgi:hypothetical protein
VGVSLIFRHTQGLSPVFRAGIRSAHSGSGFPAYHPRRNRRSKSESNSGGASPGNLGSNGQSFGESNEASNPRSYSGRNGPSDRESNGESNQASNRDRNAESGPDRNGLSNGESNGQSDVEDNLDGNWESRGGGGGGEFRRGDLALDCSRG